MDVDLSITFGADIGPDLLLTQEHNCNPARTLNSSTVCGPQHQNIASLDGEYIVALVSSAPTGIS